MGKSRLSDRSPAPSPTRWIMRSICELSRESRTIYYTGVCLRHTPPLTDTRSIHGDPSSKQTRGMTSRVRLPRGGPSSCSPIRRGKFAPRNSARKFLPRRLPHDLIAVRCCDTSRRTASRGSRSRSEDADGEHPDPVVGFFQNWRLDSGRRKRKRKKERNKGREKERGNRSGVHRERFVGGCDESKSGSHWTELRKSVDRAEKDRGEAEEGDGGGGKGGGGSARCR